MKKVGDVGNSRFDQSSMAHSTTMIKGGIDGGSDMFDGVSIADSNHFMRKESRPLDGVSIAASSEMMRGYDEDSEYDTNNKKIFDDVMSHGTFMGKMSHAN